ncbi:MAG: acylphosphatase [Draconibacterium sp.]|nr:acylphosphatase [Draconibacterium sp.]
MNYEIKITGKVQGVGFRYFAHKKAIEIGISGWVKNGRDGGVTIIAQGDAMDLNTFIDYLQIGPTRARVDNISKFNTQFSTKIEDFVIKP